MKLFYFLPILIITFSARAQGNFFEKDRVWLASAGYSYSGPSILETGLIRTSIDKKGSSDGQYIWNYFNFYYLELGSELNLNTSTPLLSPKIGIGYTFLLANFNLNYVAYNQNNKNFHSALVPEFGFSLLGIIQINYGHTINLSKSDNYNLPVNRITFRFNLVLNDGSWSRTKRD